MDISQLIGFAIMIIVLILPAIRKTMEEQDRKKNPEKYAKREREQQRLIKELIHSIDPDYEDDEGQLSSEPKPPVVPRDPSATRGQRGSRLRKRVAAPLGTPTKLPKVLKGSVGSEYEFHTDVEDRRRGSRIEGRELDSAVSHRSGDQLIADRFAYQSEIPGKREWREAKARRLLHNLSSTQDMVILHEIFSGAKGLQEDPVDHLNRQ